MSRPRGLAIFLTGLSGAGKTTIARALCGRLGEIDRRIVRVLDGDELRHTLSPDLGFTKSHRDMHILRTGYVAAEIVACNAIAICAVIAPYDEVREQVRRMIEAVGTFVLVHVATPLSICEQRDVKGLYARARADQLPDFTGISAPYEPPLRPGVTIDTTDTSVDEAVARIIAELTTLDMVVPLSTVIAVAHRARLKAGTTYGRKTR